MDTHPDPHLLHCAWLGNQRSWLQTCVVKHMPCLTELGQGSWTLTHGLIPFQSPCHASCLSVCPPMMLIILLIDFLALRIHLSVPLEHVSKTCKYWLWGSLWSTQELECEELAFFVWQLEAY